MLGYVWIYDNRPGSEYVSCNTEDDVFLQFNEYLLRDGHIQNPVKDLRQSTLEKYLQLLRFLNICRALNMSRLWIFQDCQYARALNFQGYTGFTCFHKCDKVSRMLGWNYERVLNILGFQICHGSAYAGITQGSKYALIRLNNAWINFSHCDRVQYMSGQIFTGFWMSPIKNTRAQNKARLWMCKGYTGYWICLKNTSICLNIPE